MPNSESHYKDPARETQEVLKACLWERVRPGLWEKGRSRLLVDAVGIFYYRLLDNQWVRCYGLTHNRLWRQLPDLRIVFDDGWALDLLTGE